jgi:hypothetical protein
MVSTNLSGLLQFTAVNRNDLSLEQLLARIDWLEPNCFFSDCGALR